MLELYGLEIETSRKVYEPSEDTFMAIEALERLLQSPGGNLKVLDMGTGTGIIGLYAAKSRKVSYVALADINPHAVALAQANASMNKPRLHARVEAYQSDLFSRINGAFDIIAFNAPYLRPSPMDHDMLSKAWNGGKGGIEISLRFLEGAKTHVNDKAKVILLASSLGSLKELRLAMGQYGEIVDEIKEHFFFEDLCAFTIKMSSH